MKVDFHIHSTFSDGTRTPGELVLKGCSRHLTAMALTDHDTCDGARDFLDAVPPRPLMRVAGIELSVEPPASVEKFHLLGLGVDPDSPALASLIEKVRAGRDARNREILENFHRLGIAIGDEIFDYAKGGVLARPHFAQWLVDHRVAREWQVAFDTYLLASSPPETRCYASRWRPSSDEAFAAIHAAGGVAILAHPKELRRAWKFHGVDYAVAEEAIVELKERGLDGIEAFYGANTPEMDVAFTRLADRHGLLKSAGSDFHGMARKVMGRTVSRTFIAPLFERLGLSLPTEEDAP